MKRKHLNLTAASVFAMGFCLTACGTARASQGVFRQTVSSTVFLVSPIDGQKVSVGSGALVNADARIVVTAYHVVEDRPTAVVFFAVRDETGRLVTDPSYYVKHIADLGVSGKVVATDAKRDVAVLVLESVPASAKAVPLAGQAVEPGETVHAIGNSGVEDGTLWRYSQGIVRQVYDKDLNYKHDDGSVQHVNAKVVETQCPTNSGDSGGPIVNDRGELVAITSGGTTAETDVEYGIDVSEVKAVLEGAGLAATAVAEIVPPALAVPPTANVPPALNVQPAPTLTAVVNAAPVNPRTVRPAARVTEVRQVPGVVRDGKRGLEIHVNLDLDNALGQPCDVTAVFADDASHALPAAETAYATPDGRYRGASQPVVARYTNARFTDVVLFMPYDAMLAGDATPGAHTFHVFVDVYSGRSRAYVTDKPAEAEFDLNVAAE